MVKLALNGFGRIGRTSLRVWLNRPDLQEKLSFAAINTSGSMPVASWAHLLKYDTAYGPLQFPLEFQESNQPPLIGYIILGKRYKIPVLAQLDPAKLPWRQYQIDVVIEATGAFRDEAKASAHLQAGAKKVLISAPKKGDNIESVVLGVNQYQGKFPLADNASCTTNCVAPVVNILHAAFTVQKAAITTVHAYTDDQNLQDGSHKDLRRARAASQNIIPTSTGAAKNTATVIPDLQGKFDGIAFRVPVITGSLSDLTCLIAKPTTVADVNQAFITAASSPQYQGIIATTTEPLVSSDIIGRPESAIVDLSLTQVIDSNLVKVFAWYDNEWGYANRLLEQAAVIGSK